ncbi:MAG TPA: sigma-70 family RNA polymerase sigma factor [Halothiobacillus sp.]|nr:sigma-70 family RNA polymerase sigma factor [Halothiobacillus sp.]
MSSDTPPPTFHCAERAWRAHEPELRRFILNKAHNAQSAEDLVQEAFLRAMVQGEKFCTLDNPRAWLFQICRHLLIDDWRKNRLFEERPEALDEASAEEPHLDLPLDELLDCIEPNLSTLSETDQDVIRACDLGHQTLKDYAHSRALTLPAAKSRLLRARSRLRAAMVARCGVRFDEREQVCCRSEPAPPLRP